MQGEQTTLLADWCCSEEKSAAGTDAASRVEAQDGRAGKPRFRVVNRQQKRFLEVDVDRLIPEDHPARAIWEFVGKADLTGFCRGVRAVEGVAGRSPYDPQVLISLLVYAYSEGVGSARMIEERCRWDPAYQWLTGMEVVSGHTISDFRVEHGQALKELFTEVLGFLSAEGLVTLERVTQDGTKIKASASSSSFRSRERIAECLKVAREHVEAVDAVEEEETTRQMAKARERASRGRRERLESALKEFETLRAQGGGKEKGRERVSTTDPQARVMKQPDGGYAPSFNVQISTDAANSVIVSVDVTQAGNDFEQLEPAVDRVQETFGEVPDQVVADGGYVSRDNIVGMAARGVEFIGPQINEEGKGASSYQRRGVSLEYHAEEFVYDAAMDSYLCPQGKVLVYERKEERNLQVSYKYRAEITDCWACPAKGRCCPGNEKTGRSIQRTEEFPEAANFREKMQTDAAREIYRQRSQVAEFPNLWIKAKLLLRQFHVRGLRKVWIEALWACLTYNIRQWIRLRRRSALARVMATA